MADKNPQSVLLQKTEGNESFGELLWRLRETGHQSCVLLTNREKPAEIAATEGDGFPVRTLALSRLEVTAVPILICRDSVAR